MHHADAGLAVFHGFEEVLVVVDDAHLAGGRVGDARASPVELQKVGADLALVIAVGTVAAGACLVEGAPADVGGARVAAVRVGVASRGGH